MLLYTPIVEKFRSITYIFYRIQHRKRYNDRVGRMITIAIKKNQKLNLFHKIRNYLRILRR